MRPLRSIRTGVVGLNQIAVGMAKEFASRDACPGWSRLEWLPGGYPRIEEAASMDLASVATAQT